MTTPRALFPLLLSLAACTSPAETQPASAAQSVALPQADGGAPTCALRVDDICQGGVCNIMGTAFPQALEAWCDGSRSLAYVHITSCGASTLVEIAQGDTPLELDYDASGALVAVLQSHSSGMCTGACELGCIAGAVDLSVPANDTCGPTTALESDCEGK